MDPPKAVSVESKPKPGDQTTDSKPKSYECGLCDTEVVYKIAQELLPGLASACVDNTTGGLFKNAGSVAVDMRKEMSDYLINRSETYVAEFLLSESSPVLEASEHPYDIIIILIDDFTASKRNMLSRVSEWVFSDGREDRIDDFVQEMEVNGFWVLARRESVASNLLKNVDYKNSFHCNIVCESEEEVGKHRVACKFRVMDCVNEGCTIRYCAAQKENHEAVCPFMILPCEQKCADFVMRREMDRHCVTVCPMKLVNCAFYTVGCKSCIPRSQVEQHNVDELSAHLLFIIRTAHREATEDDLKKRVEQIRSLTNTEKLARARDARALTYLIKDAEAKLEPLQSKTDSPDLPTTKNDPPTETEPLIVKDESKSPAKTEPLAVKDESKSPAKTEPLVVKDESKAPAKTEPLAAKNESGSDPPAKKEDEPVPPPSQPANEKKEVNQEPPKPEPLIKLDESKDKVESSSAPIVKEEEKKSEPPLKKDEVSTDRKESKDKPEASSTPVVKEEAKSEPPLKKEEVPKDLKEEKGKPADSKEVPKDLKEDKGKPADSKEGEKEKPIEGKKAEESVKSSVEEKNTPICINDEKDNKKSSPKKEGTIEEPAKSPAP
ncbi:hypothetical protein LXL04_026120 [Taraxacum kok-saghyz]